MILGIDLGTTNSLITYFEGDTAHVIPNRLGDRLTPSVVSVDKDGIIYVGKTALERQQTNPDETASVFKRSMGSSKEYRLGKRCFTPTELSGFVLKSLKEDAQEYLGYEVQEAVISVPAYFNNAQRKATKRAGELAGFTVDRIVSEPTAAAIAYGLNKRDSDTKFLVFDLGGGTFDVSILELYKNVMEVRAVAGDNYLGGEEFTEVLVQMFLRDKKLDINDINEKTMIHIRKQAELCKLGFSSSKTSVLKCRINEDSMEYEIDIDDYERACQVLLGKLRRPVERSLRDAHIKLSDISEVILVGGSTKLPIVRKFVAKLFGKLPNSNINPDEVVAVGAGVQAAMKERNEAVKEVVLTDVCPYTLGTEVSRHGMDDEIEAGHYLPVIDRNTVIPVSRTERLYTVYDNQSQIRVKILQGESRFALNNLYLGDLVISIPIAPAGKECVDVTYTYDVNSILEVIVKVVSTDVTKKLVIKNEETDMTDEEIEQRLEELADLKIHPREQEENKLLLLRGDRMYEEAIGTTRRKIERKLEEFEKLLNKQNKEEIVEAAKEFKTFLDGLEDDLI